MLALALVIAQACYLEATWRPDDCAAIAHVLVRRARHAGVPVAEMAHRYSLDKRTPRAARARAMTATELEPLVRIAEGVLQGKVRNPCPRAIHWGSPHLGPDVARAGRAISQGRWVVVVCRKATANVFYATKAP